MKPGTLYGVGVGPGDSELVTVKGSRIIAKCPNLFAPKARSKSQSVALAIVAPYVTGSSVIHELIFPMVSDKAELKEKWDEAAEKIATVLRKGEDACFITLGDPLLYSTYIYLLRSLKQIMPQAEVVTVPGITAFCTVAALANFPVGEGSQSVTIVPAAEDLTSVREAIFNGGTVILMKVGKKLPGVIELLEEAGVIENAVFVAHAGMDNQIIETNLLNLKGADEEAGYLSTILVHAGNGGRNK